MVHTAGKGILEEHWINSDHLGSRQVIQVGLPPRYAPLASFPLLLVLDGDDYRQQGRLPSLQHQHFLRSTGAQWLTVYIPCSVSERVRYYHPESPSRLEFQRFLAEELIPFLEHTYSTWVMGAGRGLLGSSLSAACALDTAFTFPNTFQTVCAQSPYLPDRLIAGWTAKAKRDQHLPLQICLSAGIDETTYTLRSGEQFDFLQAAKQFQTQLSPYVTELLYRKHGGGHTWGSWQSDLQDIFSFLENVWELPLEEE